VSPAGAPSTLPSGPDSSPAPWHAASGVEVLERLSSRRDGLTAGEAEQRLAEHGGNQLTRQRGPSAGVLLRQFTSPLIYALLISAVVAFALGDSPDGAVVLGVVVLNALIGFVREYRAGKAIQALAQLVSDPATVRRDGRWTRAGAETLVPGDVVSLEAGARVVADLRILQARGMSADESALTGESVPVGKAPEPVEAATELADRRSLLYSGTLVTTGSAEAVVVATGDRTELGRISGLISSVEDTQTPLTRSIAQLGSTVTKVVGVVAVVLLGVALLRGYPFVDAALAAITLAVAAIPRGSPRSSPSRWRSVCSGWSAAARWCGSWRRSRRWGRPPSCARTRPGPSPATRWCCAVPGPRRVTRRSSRGSGTRRRAGC
jgi:magnesium-transporting ATPase (P-type)